MTFNSKSSNFHQHYLPLPTPYRYQILTQHYLEQVIDVFTRSFCRAEPMTHYLKMDEDKYKIFARSVAEKAIEDQLSVVALDDEKVIAFALIEDIADPGPIPDFDPKFNYILGLLEKLGEDLFKNTVFSKKQIAHLFITAVDEQYRHQHLSTQVNFRSMDVALQAGFDFMYCEFTHFYNELGVIHHLQNWKRKIGSQRYQDFIMKSEKPFKLLEGEANSYLWKLHEDANLTAKKSFHML